MKKTNVNCKNSELISILNTHFKGKVNLARIKLISFFIIALIKVQTVNFEKLSHAFDSKTKSESSLRRIQRFIANYSFDSDLIARLVFSLLPKQDKYILSIDRTNWKFGKANINIFMLGIVYQGIAFPLLFTMLPKRGNSNSQERINLINRFGNLFGLDIIDSIVADREFIGNEWLKYLSDNQIRYYIRIRNNFKVFMPHKNKEIKAFRLFDKLKVNEFTYYPKVVKVNGQLCYISGAKLKIKKNKREFLIIISFNKPENAQEQYKQRWQIEMTFKAMKTSGFNIEKTHLQDIKRLEKLVLLTMIAFVWAYKVGIYLHELKPITIKKHGRKAKSIFKYGLSHLAKTLLNSEFQNDIGIFKFLSCT